MIFILPLIFTLVATISAKGSYPPYGQLQVVGPHITDLSGNVVQLRGMSLYYSQWKAKFYNLQTIQALRSAWNANVVRVAMGTDRGGYLTNPEKEWTNVKNVIEASIETGIYVIVDWHIIGANPNKDKALAFFSNISQTYGCYPHIIYEIWNEPANTTWDVVKAYANELIPAIRRYDPNNIIIVGTTTWSQDNDIAANDPITGYSNIAYTLHYYAGTHKQSLRNKTIAAINKGLPIFVTEYGTAKVGGGVNGTVYPNESNTWWAFDDQYKLSYVNWHLSDVDEPAAALLPNTSASQVGDATHWRSSGILVNQKYQKTDQGLGKPLVPFPLSTCAVTSTCNGTGIWSFYSGYSSCSTTCGGETCGTMYKYRICSPPAGCSAKSTTCTGVTTKQTTCGSSIPCESPSQACCAGYEKVAVNSTFVCQKI